MAAAAFVTKLMFMNAVFTLLEVIEAVSHGGVEIEKFAKQLAAIE